MLIYCIPTNNKWEYKRLKHIKKPITINKNCNFTVNQSSKVQPFFIMFTPPQTKHLLLRTILHFSSMPLFIPFKAVFAKEHSFSMFLDGSHSVGVQLVELSPFSLYTSSLASSLLNTSSNSLRVKSFGRPIHCEVDQDLPSRLQTKLRAVQQREA